MNNNTPVPIDNHPLEAMQRADIDMQMATARRYPRDLVTVKQKMLAFATLDEETAESCFFTLPRGGKSIQGPSVRLAEIAMACYGNIRAGSRILETVAHGENPYVVVQGVAHDLETNSAISMEQRRRITKKQSKSAPDDDDISLATNACSAIAFRNAVFKVVPGALIKPIFEAARDVAVGNAKSLVERRTRAIEKLGKMGITPDRVCNAVGKTSVEAIGLEELATLFGMHTAIKDGHVTIEEAFPPVSGAVVGAKPNLKEEAKTEPKTESKTEPAAQTTPPATQAPPAATTTEEPKKAKAKKEKAPEPPAQAAATAPAETTPTPDNVVAMPPGQKGVTNHPELANTPESAAAIAPHAGQILDEALSTLAASKIKVEDFLGWLAASGRGGLPQKDGAMLPFPALNAVPPELLARVMVDGKAMGKCKALYGAA